MPYRFNPGNYQADNGERVIVGPGGAWSYYQVLPPDSPHIAWGLQRGGFYLTGRERFHTDPGDPGTRDDPASNAIHAGRAGEFVIPAGAFRELSEAYGAGGNGLRGFAMGLAITVLPALAAFAAAPAVAAGAGEVAAVAGGSEIAAAAALEIPAEVAAGYEAAYGSGGLQSLFSVPADVAAGYGAAYGGTSVAELASMTGAVQSGAAAATAVTAGQVVSAAKTVAGMAAKLLAGQGGAALSRGPQGELLILGAPADEAAKSFIALALAGVAGYFLWKL